MSTTQLLIDEVATKLNVTKKEAKETLENISETIVALLLKGEDVRVPGLATFTTDVKPGREGIAPSTGKPYKTEAKRVVKVKMLKPVRDAVAELPIN